MRKEWQFEKDRLIAPNGWEFLLRELLVTRSDQISGRIDLRTTEWSGWRIRQQYLVAPGQHINESLNVRALAHLTRNALRNA
jgi:hypothetical protein